MVIHIEIRKIEKVFGKDRWAVRFGNIVGSTDMHNISKAYLIKSIIDEIEEEAKRLADDKVNKIIISEVFDKFVYGIETKLSKKFHSPIAHAICYNFKEELRNKLIAVANCNKEKQK